MKIKYTIINLNGVFVMSAYIQTIEMAIAAFIKRTKTLDKREDNRCLLICLMHQNKVYVR